MEKSSIPLRQRLRDAAAEAMLDSAESAMIAKGYERATMQEIAAAAGCATGTFYLYFKNKEELFQAIVTRHMGAIFEAARSAVDGSALPQHQLRASVAAALRYVLEHKPFFRLFFTAMPMRYLALREKVGGKALAVHDVHRQMDVDIIRAAQAAGQLRQDHPAELLHDYLNSVCMGLVEQFVFAATEMPIEEQIQTLWSFVGSGLGLRGSGDGTI